MVDVVGLLFWLLFLSMVLSPVINFWRLKSARLRLISYMERKYGMRIITLIHRQERIGMFGIPLYRFIDIDDSEAVLRALRSTPEGVPVAIILHTPGGLVLAAVQIAMALKRHNGRKIVIVPHYAMSGGTLIALAADEIWTDPNAVLGPLDPQLALEPGIHVPAPSIIKAAKMKGEAATDKLLVMADIAEKAVREVGNIVYQLLSGRLEEEKARELARVLTEGRWTHDYPMTAEEARKLGLPIKMGIPPEVYTLMELYPQAPVNRPGVEYIPRPAAPRPYRSVGEKS